MASRVGAHPTAPVQGWPGLAASRAQWGRQVHRDETSPRQGRNSGQHVDQCPDEEAQQGWMCSPAELGRNRGPHAWGRGGPGLVTPVKGCQCIQGPDMHIW